MNSEVLSLPVDLAEGSAETLALANGAAEKCQAIGVEAYPTMPTPHKSLRLLQ